MNIKEKFLSLDSKKRNIYYWAAFFIVIDLVLIVQHTIQFSLTGQCRNYMEFGSSMQACTFFEFAKYGWSWLSFTNLLIFLPAAATMVFASQIVDIIFAKKK